MKITVLPSDKGDCLLITAKDGTTMLADGGMRGSYLKHVRPFLGERAAAGEDAIDLVYVSHIDQDHIAGVLQLMDDLVAWRVYEARKDDGWAEPEFPRPPAPKAIWHNAFHEQVGRNAGPIESMLAASAASIANSASPRLRELATEYREIATSIPEAIRLSRRVSPEQLGIPLNEPFGGKLAMVREDAAPFGLGSMRVTIIGPFEDDLARLRTEWNAWLRDHREKLAELKRKAREDEELLGASASAPLGLDADGGLGDRDAVTAPNLASLMLLLEEDGRRVVLTGDGHHREVARGLELAGVLPADGGGGHVDVLKVQHHGSEHNIDRDFARRLTADHYVFCGNGKHENPDLCVLRALAESRVGPPARRSKNPEAGRPFTFWFSSGPDSPGAARSHMGEVEALVEDYAQQSGGRLRFSFPADDPLELSLDE